MNDAVDKIIHYAEVPRMTHLIEVSFEVHDALILPLSVWVNHNLKVDMPLTNEIIRCLETEAAVAKAKDHALGYLKWKPRTAREVLQYLVKKQYETTVCQRVVFDLEQSGVVDDAAYASLYVQQKRGQASRRAISWKLEQRGIARDVIQSALDDNYAPELEAETARVIACKFDRKGQRLPLQKRRQRLGMYLQRQGFPTGLVRRLAYELSDFDADEGFLDND